MLENAFARLECEVQAVMCRITLLQLIDHPQALQVVLETAMRGHAIIKGVLPGVAEGRMPQVMCQCDRFHQVFIQPQ